jgi:hypothetical protein
MYFKKKEGAQSIYIIREDGSRMSAKLVDSEYVPPEDPSSVRLSVKNGS